MLFFFPLSRFRTFDLSCSERDPYPVPAPACFAPKRRTPRRDLSIGERLHPRRGSP